jgi:small-conductance mechanosensitive channel
MSDDAFLRTLIADWRDEALMKRSPVAESHRWGRPRMLRGLVLTGATLIVMGACSAWFTVAALQQSSILILIAALTYGASTALMAFVLWGQARAFSINYDQTPVGVLEQGRAAAQTLRRHLVGVRWASIILLSASGAVGASFMFGATSRKTAIILAGAWAATAAGLWLWQSTRSGTLKAEVESCDRLIAELRQADE